MTLHINPEMLRCCMTTSSITYSFSLLICETVISDAWRISGEDRAKHDAQFFQLKPVNGFVTGKLLNKMYHSVLGLYP